MKTLDQIAQEMSQLAYEKDVEGFKRKVDRMVVFVESASVEVKKVSVSKKGPTYGNPSSLCHRGVWGYPQVFVTNGNGAPIQVKHRFMLAPFLIVCSYLPDYGKIFKIDDDPAVPELFTHDSQWRVCRAQHGTQDLGIWMAESCPSLFELDKLVRAEWDEQVEAFPKEADRYVDKLGGRQRTNFQNKLVKEFGKHKGSLMGVPPNLVYEVFRFTRDHQTAMSSLVNFCAKNRADAAFIDESDVEAALKLAEVAEVMEK